MSSLRGPHGAAPESGAFELRSRALDPGRPRASARARTGHAALGLLLVSALVLAAAAPQTDALLPESVRPIPDWLAGPFGGLGLGLGVIPLLGLLALMFVSYAVAVPAARPLSPRA